MDVCSARRASSAGLGTVGVGLGLRFVGMTKLLEQACRCDVKVQLPSRPPSGIAGVGWPWATAPGEAAVSPHQTIVQVPHLAMCSRIVDAPYRRLHDAQPSPPGPALEILVVAFVLVPGPLRLVRLRV